MPARWVKIFKNSLYIVSTLPKRKKNTLEYFSVCQKMRNFAITHMKFKLIITPGESIGKANQMPLKLVAVVYTTMRITKR